MWPCANAQVLSVDLTAMVAHEYLYLAVIHHLLGDGNQAASCVRKACAITKSLVDEAWDEQQVIA